MNKLLNYKTKTKNATSPIFTEIVALFFFTNCQRWDHDSKAIAISSLILSNPLPGFSKLIVSADKKQPGGGGLFL